MHIDISFLKTLQVVLTEVVESERGANYIKNLHEVYAVFRRIKTSFEESSLSTLSGDLEVNSRSTSDLEVKFEVVEKHWAAFRAAVGAADSGGGGSLPDFCGNATTPEVSDRK